MKARGPDCSVRTDYQECAWSTADGHMVLHHSQIHSMEAEVTYYLNAPFSVLLPKRGSAKTLKICNAVSKPAQYNTVPYACTQTWAKY